jgi:hypothetical protein
MDGPPHPEVQNWDFAGPGLNPHIRNVNDRTRNVNLPRWGLTYTIYLRGHLPVIYKIFLDPIGRTTEQDPVNTMVVFNRKHFATFQFNSALHMRLIITLMSTFNNGSTKSPSGPILVGPLFLYKP